MDFITSDVHLVAVLFTYLYTVYHAYWCISLLHILYITAYITYTLILITEYSLLYLLTIHFFFSFLAFRKIKLWFSVSLLS